MFAMKIYEAYIYCDTSHGSLIDIDAHTSPGFLRKNDNLGLCAVFIIQALPHNHISLIDFILMEENKVPQKLTRGR
jgi:hypothetical protein